MTQSWQVKISLDLHRTLQRMTTLENNGAAKRTAPAKKSVDEGADQATDAIKRQKVETDWLRQVHS